MVIYTYTYIYPLIYYYQPASIFPFLTSGLDSSTETKWTKPSNSPLGPTAMISISWPIETLVYGWFMVGFLMIFPSVSHGNPPKRYALPIEVVRSFFTRFQSIHPWFEHENCWLWIVHIIYHNISGLVHSYSIHNHSQPWYNHISIITWHIYITII